jgi:hypothetical protein
VTQSVKLRVFGQANTRSNKATGSKSFMCKADRDEWPLFCDRCQKRLFPGQSGFYRADILAVLDPSPPVFLDEDVARATRAEYERFVRQQEDGSAQEANDEISRHVTVYLCESCFRTWIDNPTGDAL